MKNATKGKVIKGAALTLDVSAPLVATICQFPIWVEKSSAATISGVFLLFAFFSFIPFLGQIKKWLQSPSVPMLWFFFLIAFTALRNIIDQMWFICLIGVLSNSVGSIIYKSGTVIGDKPDKEVDEGADK